MIISWFYDFLQRFLELKIVKPQNLSMLVLHEAEPRNTNMTQSALHVNHTPKYYVPPTVITNIPLLKSCNFVCDCKQMKLEYIKDHETTKLHMRAMLKKMPPAPSSEAGKALQKLQNGAYQQLNYKFSKDPFCLEKQSFFQYVWEYL